MGARPSDGRWIFPYRCRGCGERFERRRAHLLVGPLRDMEPGASLGEHRLADGRVVRLREGAPVYDGPIHHWACIDCQLTVMLPGAMERALWDEWLAREPEARERECDPVLAGYVALVQESESGCVGVRGDPPACLRCGGEMTSARHPQWRCPRCRSDRLDLLRSRWV